jgi:hypothetical protein
MLKRVFVAAVAVLLISTVFTFSMWTPLRRQRGIKSPATQISPDRFFVVVFPRSPDVTLKQKANPAATKKLDRAVLSSLNELKNASMGVIEGNTEYEVATKDLTASLVPHHQAMVDGLNRAIQGWGDATDWRRVEVHAAPNPGGHERVQLKRVNKEGDSVTFSYEVHGEQITPKDVETWRPLHRL